MYLAFLVILVALLVYLLLAKTYNYWTERGVKQRPQTYFFGDTTRVFFHKETFTDLVKKLYNSFPDERYIGVYQMITPALVIKDLKLIKEITVKEFDHFMNHRSLLPDGLDELWSRNLFFLKDNKWRDIRSTMSPSFTTSKMKMMFNLISKCAEDFNKYFLDLASRELAVVELKDTFTRYTNDVIASVAFGIECDSLKERDNEFYVMGKTATSLTGFWKSLKLFMYMGVPKICKMLNLTMYSQKVRLFFQHVIKEAISVREEKGLIRPDMIHLLMEARKGRLHQEDNEKLLDTGFATAQESDYATMPKKIIRQEITDLDITAQALSFFFGGFESVSTLMCFIGHELAIHPDIQRRLQEEIDATLKECNGNLTYEALLKMKYMDMVVSESLRKWPVGVLTDRVCTKPYVIQPVKENEKPVYLNRGDILYIPITGLHYDPKYFPDPDRFDPERFNDENKNNIKTYSYIPFGVGPRNCIGSRLALIETKTLFFHLLSRFDLVVTEKTQIPLKLSKLTFNLLAERGFWVGLKQRTNIKAT